ncbi:MAG TPA: hypothetical protein VGN20_19430 [Mucilaginibacter sp.]|jgi:tetratricopeptide (TPR) repeat protein
MNKVSLLILLLIFCYGCSHSQVTQVQAKVNPEALKLNNQAMQLYANSLGINDRNKTLEQAVNLLNKAVKIDSGYFRANWNKCLIQNTMKQYDSALVTSKQILKLRPKNVDIQLMVGTAYERAGDTVSAAKYYTSTLLTYNNILDTMSIKNEAYKTLKVGKAITLIMLHQDKKGYDMFKELYTTETDPNYKPMYQNFIGLTRHDFLYGPEEKVTSEDPIPITH